MVDVWRDIPDALRAALFGPVSKNNNRDILAYADLVANTIFRLEEILQAPRTTARRNIEQRILNFAHIGRARAAPALGGWDNGGVSSHSRSVISLGYRNPSRLCSHWAIPVHIIVHSISS